MKDKTIGILGGMGPEATIALADSILQFTPIKKEQDHLRVIIDNNPKMPDRTKAILSGDTDAHISMLTETALNLERAGADLILIPCNTAHYFLEDIRKAVGIEVLDMIFETAVYFSETFPHIKKAGIMGTPATCRMKLYQNALLKLGIASEEPGEEDQSLAMKAISLVKEQNGHARARIILSKIAGRLVEEGAEAIIGGCTEIPLALKAEDLDVPFIDPSRILARKAVIMAKGEARDV